MINLDFENDELGDPVKLMRIKDEYQYAKSVVEDEYPHLHDKLVLGDALDPFLQEVAKQAIRFKYQCIDDGVNQTSITEVVNAEINRIIADQIDEYAG